MNDCCCCCQQGKTNGLQLKTKLKDKLGKKKKRKEKRTTANDNKKENQQHFHLKAIKYFLFLLEIVTIR